MILQSFVLTVSQDLRAGLPDVWSGSHSRKAQCGRIKVPELKGQGRSVDAGGVQIGRNPAMSVHSPALGTDEIDSWCLAVCRCVSLQDV